MPSLVPLLGKSRTWRGRLCLKLVMDRNLDVISCLNCTDCRSFFVTSASERQQGFRRSRREPSDTPLVKARPALYRLRRQGHVLQDNASSPSNVARGAYGSLRPSDTIHECPQYRVLHDYTISNSAAPYSASPNRRARTCAV